MENPHQPQSPQLVIWTLADMADSTYTTTITTRKKILKTKKDTICKASVDCFALNHHSDPTVFDNQGFHVQRQNNVTLLGVSILVCDYPQTIIILEEVFLFFVFLNQSTRLTEEIYKLKLTLALKLTTSIPLKDLEGSGWWAQLSPSGLPCDSASKVPSRLIILPWVKHCGPFLHSFQRRAGGAQISILQIVPKVTVPCQKQLYLPELILLEKKCS